MNRFWINYSEFSKVGVDVYRNFIPNGAFVRGLGSGLGFIISRIRVDRGRIRVSDLNCRD